MPTTHFPLIIVGAGQAAAQLILALRKRKDGRAILLLGDEGELPYQRPPLSKAYLKGEFDGSRLPFRPADYYAVNSVECRLDDPAIRIDVSGKSVETVSGRIFTYDDLVLATGSHARALPGLSEGLSNTQMLRHLKDSEAIGAALEKASHLTVIGGGYIGLEVAAVARSLGREVTVLEREDRLLARVTTPVVSDFYAKLHRQHGVDLRLGLSITGMQEDNERLAGLTLSDGTEIEVDQALIGIGGAPHDSLAQAAGIECDNGILVDEDARTSVAHIYAAGDCARRPAPRGDSLIRIESVHNAIDQADRIAAHLTGADRPTGDAPWFWSDQYDVKLQTAGICTGYTDTVIRGDTAEAPFSVFYFAGEHLIAADCLNDPASFLSAKQFLKLELPVSKSDLADDTIPIKTILKKAREATED